MLVDWLRAEGWTVLACRDPGGTVIGDRIRELLLDTRSVMSLTTEAMLYVASRAQLVNDLIKPALARGELVVSDRFLLANVVYQGHAGGLAPESLWQIGTFATGSLLPNLTVILDVPAEVGMGRRQGPADRIESRGLEFHQRVRDGFLTEARCHPDSMVMVNAARGMELVQSDVRREVARVLGTRPRP